MFDDLPPTLARRDTMARWDYVQADLKEFNAEIYGEKLSAEHFDQVFPGSDYQPLVPGLQPDALENGDLLGQ